MKNIFLTFCLVTQLVVAQQAYENKIEIMPFINTEKTNIPTEAQAILEGKLLQLLLKNGVSNAYQSDIVLTANAVVLGKEITPTAPANYILELSMNLYIGNGKDGNLFSSTQFHINGIGQSEAKAYIDAIKKLNSNSLIEKFIADAKVKIIKYYNEKCDVIIAEASRLEKTNNYDAALYKLLSVPQACTNCFNKTVSKAAVVYKKSINADGKEKLHNAKQIWNASPNDNGAYEATKILMTINPEATCINEAKAFGNEISKKMKENDTREWKLYYEKEVGLEKDSIEAMKEIGKAYGQGQPKQVCNNVKWW